MRSLVLLSVLMLPLLSFANLSRPTGTMSALDQSVRECVMLKYTGAIDGEAGSLSMKYEDINEMSFTFSEPGCRWTVTGHAKVPTPGGFSAYTKWWVCVNLDAKNEFVSSFITHKRLYLN
ncbi:MAG: hypothetical protein KF767_09230 [Bdellovibrionaceae bacterium]|nr:hypothetical protein [Pseudobdellovibrionaceae bacterium]